MFKFLKDKLKGAIGRFSKEVDKEVEKEVVERDVPVEEAREKKGFFQKIFGKKEKAAGKKLPEPISEEKKPVEKPKVVEEKKPEIKPKPIEGPKQIIAEEKKPEIGPEIKVQRPGARLRPVEKPEPVIVEETGREPKIKPEPVEVKVEKPEIIEKKAATVEETKVEPAKEEKKGFFTRIAETFTKFNLSEQKFEELFWELEVVLLENNVAVEVIDKIKADMKRELMSGKISRKGVEELILETLKESIIELFDIDTIDLLKKIKQKKQKPYIIAIIGVNGSGKTTSIAKLTHMFQKNGLSVVLAASDTFRAAAIQQLEEHAKRLDAKLIKHDYNSDPAAVAFDAIKYAQAKGSDVVIIDTAGRLHSNTNLMNELEKVVRVCKPDIKIFVGESITGNDCIEQAKEFDRIAGIDAIILAKADIDEKGGAAISVSYVTKKPILYLGTGQAYDDLKAFDSRLIIENLEL